MNAEFWSGVYGCIAGFMIAVIAVCGYVLGWLRRDRTKSLRSESQTSPVSQCMSWTAEFVDGSRANLYCELPATRPHRVHVALVNAHTYVWTTQDHIVKELQPDLQGRPTVTYETVDLSRRRAADRYEK